MHQKRIRPNYLKVLPYTVLTVASLFVMNYSLCFRYFLFFQSAIAGYILKPRLYNTVSLLCPLFRYILPVFCFLVWDI